MARRAARASRAEVVGAVAGGLAVGVRAVAGGDVRADVDGPEAPPRAVIEAGVVEDRPALAWPVSIADDRLISARPAGHEAVVPEGVEVDEEDRDAGSLPGAEDGVQIVFLDLGVVEIFDDVD